MRAIRILVTSRLRKLGSCFFSFYLFVLLFWNLLDLFRSDCQRRSQNRYPKISKLAEYTGKKKEKRHKIKINKKTFLRVRLFAIFFLFLLIIWKSYDLLLLLLSLALLFDISNFYSNIVSSCDVSLVNHPLSALKVTNVLIIVNGVVCQTEWNSNTTYAVVARATYAVVKQKWMYIYFCISMPNWRPVSSRWAQWTVRQTNRLYFIIGITYMLL